jgi:septal ring factor EnvC (AmiA/AmiB activator)
LQTELELKKVRKAELEAELRTLTAEIEAGEKNMAELPESMERIRKEATATLSVGKQLKTTSTVLNINEQTVWSRYMQIWSRNIFYDQLMTKLNWSQKLRHIWSAMTNRSFWS